MQGVDDEAGGAPGLDLAAESERKEVARAIFFADAFEDQDVRVHRQSIAIAWPARSHHRTSPASSETRASLAPPLTGTSTLLAREQANLVRRLAA